MLDGITTHESDRLGFGDAVVVRGKLHEVLDNRGDTLWVRHIPQRVTTSSKGLVEMEGFVQYPCGDCAIIPLPVFTDWWPDTRLRIKHDYTRSRIRVLSGWWPEKTELEELQAQVEALREVE